MMHCVSISEAAPLFEQTTNHVLKGKFHHRLRLCIKEYHRVRATKDYVDQALIEYTAASFYFEEAVPV